MSQVFHDIEKKIITSLKENPIQTPETLEKSTQLLPDQIRRGIEWLKLKNLAIVDESKSSTISLGKNGLDSFEKGLPERRLLNLVKNGPRKLSDLQKELGFIFGPAMGLCRKNNWIETSSDQIILKTIPSILPGEKTLQQIGSAKLSKGELDIIDLNELLKRPDFIIEDIVKSKVAVANVKLYVNRGEGFVGHSLRKSDSEFVSDCSDIDDIIVIRRDGILMVSKISDKQFVGKDIIHVDVWKKGDERTIYNLIYLDGKSKHSMVKRFAVKSITRDKEYPLTSGAPNSKVLYLTANPNGEAETVKVLLKPKPNVKRLKFDFEFPEIAIKGRASKGNILSKYTVHKIELKEAGVSTLGGRNIWWDETVQRLNTEGRGTILGEFNADDKILSIMQSGHYKLSAQTINTHFYDDMIIIEKYDPNKVYSLVYFDGAKANYYVKRFLIEPSDKKTLLISEHENSKLLLVSSKKYARIKIIFDKRTSNKEDEEVEVTDFISVKGQKSQGNRLSGSKVKTVLELEPIRKEEVLEIASEIEEAIEIKEPDEVSESSVEVESIDEVEQKPRKESIKPVSQPKEIKIEDKRKVEVEKLKPESKEPPAPKPRSKVKPKIEKVEEKPVAKKAIKEEKVKAVKAKQNGTPTDSETKTTKENKGSNNKGDDDDIPLEGPVQITLDL